LLPGDTHGEAGSVWRRDGEAATVPAVRVTPVRGEGASLPTLDLCKSLIRLYLRNRRPGRGAAGPSSRSNGDRGTTIPDGSLEGLVLGKFLLFLLLGLGAALYFPQTRPVVLDTLAPVLNPILTWQTKGEMAQITRELQMINREGQALPEPGEDFQAWMGRNFQGGDREDSWGNPYTLVTWPDSVGVVSKGPDLEIHTPDDILETALIPRQRRRR